MQLTQPWITPCFGTLPQVKTVRLTPAMMAKPSVITNVANGQINETSTDAVNGSQLNATNMLIQNIAGDTSESYITEKR